SLWRSHLSWVRGTGACWITTANGSQPLGRPAQRPGDEVGQLSRQDAPQTRHGSGVAVAPRGLRAQGAGFPAPSIALHADGQTAPFGAALLGAPAQVTAAGRRLVAVGAQRLPGCLVPARDRCPRAAGAACLPRGPVSAATP